ncbi:hypothetical protein VTO42DRAFT_6182 [Malbranchea cinnamomea]
MAQSIRARFERYARPNVKLGLDTVVLRTARHDQGHRLPPRGLAVPALVHLHRPRSSCRSPRHAILRTDQVEKSVARTVLCSARKSAHTSSGGGHRLPAVISWFVATANFAKTRLWQASMYSDNVVSRVSSSNYAALPRGAVFPAPLYGDPYRESLSVAEK